MWFQICQSFKYNPRKKYLCPPPGANKKNPFRRRNLWKILTNVLAIWATKKNPLTFHYTGCLTGIRYMAYYNPRITGVVFHPEIYPKQPGALCFIASGTCLTGLLRCLVWFAQHGPTAGCPAKHRTLRCGDVGNNKSHLVVQWPGRKATYAWWQISLGKL